MAIDASDLPMEGQNFNSDQLLPDVTSIMMNLPNIARSIGAKRPDPLVDNPRLNRMPQPPNNKPPSSDIIPDNPRSLKLPQPKMMPGADTAPGQVLSKSDVEEFNRRVSMTSVPTQHVLQQQYVHPVNVPSNEEPIFFEDCVGNKFKMVNGKLFVMGWQDANVKIRVINEKTGKEMPSSGKKFQIYGWHSVNKIDETKNSNKIEELKKVDDIDLLEESVSKKESSPAEDVKNTSEVEKIVEKQKVVEQKNENKVTTLKAETTKIKPKRKLI